MIKRPPHNPYLTEIDGKLLPSIIDYAQQEMGRKFSYSIEDITTYSDIISCLKDASKKVEARISNDLPHRIASLLSNEEWNEITAEYHHYNNSIEEIRYLNTSPFHDYMAYFFYAEKLNFILKKST